jgi:glucan phosphoethanolaminetransferase (alkaline phosphatase superfamily)
MVIFLVIALLLIVAIFGITSGMQSYATAQQAQAQIETAKVAQISSWGNLMTILMIMLIVLAALALIAAILWLAYRNLIRKSLARPSRAPSEIKSTPQPQFLNDLIQLEMLRTLKSINGSSQPTLLSAPTEEPPTDEPFSWLK